MVRFSFSARSLFFATVCLVHQPSSTDAYIIPSQWGVSQKRAWKHSHSHPIPSSLRAKSSGSPHPPDTPPPPAYFAAQENPTTESPRAAVAPDPPTPLYSEQDLEEFRRFSNELGHKAVEYVIRPIADIQKGVPSERIKGAAITGAVVGLLASKGIVVSSAAGVSAAYLAISKGVAGDVLRTVGGIAWDVTDTAARLLSIVANNEKLSMLPRGLAQKTLDALQTSQLSARHLESADSEDVEAAQQAFLASQEDLARVLEEAEAVIGEADQAIAKAQALEDELRVEEDVIDVSVPYDAAAKLAYEESDKSIPFSTFKIDFLANAVEMVKSKQQARLWEREEAIAQQRAEEERQLEEEASAEADANNVEEAIVTVSDEIDEDSDDSEYMDEEDFLASIELAQEGLDGKIVGVEEAIADTTAKAEWDAAGSLARELQQDEVSDLEDDDDDEIMIGSDVFEGLDLEELGKAAREAVDMFDEMEESVEELEDWDEVTEEDEDWSLMTVSDLRTELRNRGLPTAGKKVDLVERLESDVDGDDGEHVEDDEDNFDDVDLATMDMEELGSQAREAVQMFQTEADNFDEEEPTAEMLAELESEMTINGALGDGETEDFSAMTVAELKDECRTRGLKVSGRKAELVERLQSATG